MNPSSRQIIADESPSVMLSEKCMTESMNRLDLLGEVKVEVAHSPNRYIHLRAQ